MFPAKNKGIYKYVLSRIQKECKGEANVLAKYKWEYEGEGKVFSAKYKGNTKEKLRLCSKMQRECKGKL